MKKLNPQVRVLVAGRFISHTGTGFTLFYAPIFFVDRVGLSPTLVGLALGTASLSGIAGRILGGSLSDSPSWGRKRILLVSALVCAIASLVLAATQDLMGLVAGNLLAGFGIGLYWPAVEAVVADWTPSEERREAYAWTRLADNVGLQLGILLGGVVISTMGTYRLLFVVDALSFLVFLGLVWAMMSEPPSPAIESSNFWAGWREVIGDRALWIYVAVNVIFTTYLAQIHTTMPLYLSNRVPVNNGNGFSTEAISGLFAWHTALLVLLQLPVAKILKRFSHSQALLVSALGWVMGFVLVWTVGVVPTAPLGWAMAALGILAMATVSFTPSASALVVDLAPSSLRGVYLSINSLCWSVGYLIGPPLGGWAMDGGETRVYSFWLCMAASGFVAILILQSLHRQRLEKS